MVDKATIPPSPSSTAFQGVLLKDIWLFPTTGGGHQRQCLSLSGREEHAPTSSETPERAATVDLTGEKADSQHHSSPVAQMLLQCHNLNPCRAVRGRYSSLGTDPTLHPRAMDDGPQATDHWTVCRGDGL